MKKKSENLFSVEFMAPAAEIPSERELSLFFEGFYRRKKSEVDENASIRNVLRDFVKLSKFMSDLGLPQFSALQKMFRPEFTRNLAEAQNVKKTMELIIFMVSRKKDEQKNLVKSLKNRDFYCGKETLSNLQLIACELIFGKENLKGKIAKSKREFIENVVKSQLRDGAFKPRFSNSLEMESENVKILVNEIAKEFALEKYRLTGQQNVQTKEAAKFKEFLLNAVDVELDNDGISKIFENAIEEITALFESMPQNLAQADEQVKNEINHDVTKLLTEIFSNEDLNNAFLIEFNENYEPQNFKSNFKQLIEFQAKIHLHEMGLREEPEIDYFKKVIAIEKEWPLREGKLQANLTPEIENYMMKKDLKFLKNGSFKSIFEFLGRDKTVEFLQNHEEIKGENSVIYALKNLPDGLHPALTVASVSSLLKKAKNSNDIEILLGQGADINYLDASDKTPLFYACENGDLDQLKCLVMHGADVDFANDSKETPLFHACLFKKPEIVKELIKCGANVDAKNRFNRTPLFRACFLGENEIAKELIKNGANTDIKSDHEKNLELQSNRCCATFVMALLLHMALLVYCAFDSNSAAILFCASFGVVSVYFAIETGQYDAKLAKTNNRKTQYYLKQAMQEIEQERARQDELVIEIDDVQIELEPINQQPGVHAQRLLAERERQGLQSLNV